MIRNTDEAEPKCYFIHILGNQYISNMSRLVSLFGEVRLINKWQTLYFVPLYLFCSSQCHFCSILTESSALLVEIRNRISLGSRHWLNQLLSRWLQKCWHFVFILASMQRTDAVERLSCSSGTRSSMEQVFLGTLHRIWRSKPTSRQQVNMKEKKQMGKCVKNAALHSGRGGWIMPLTIGDISGSCLGWIHLNKRPHHNISHFQPLACTYCISNGSDLFFHAGDSRWIPASGLHRRVMDTIWKTNLTDQALRGCEDGGSVVTLLAVWQTGLD